MRAETVSIGTELLMGQIIDADAAAIGQFCAEHGLSHFYRQTVGDNLERATESIRLALSRNEIVFTIGGLGPTSDDLTREAIAAAVEQPLVHDPALADELREIFKTRGLSFSDSQLRQALRPRDSKAIPNPNGTAPGLICPVGDKFVVALPGPPSELLPMLAGPIHDWIESLSSAPPISIRIFRVAGMGEATVTDKIGDLLQSSRPMLAPYAKTGEVHLRGSIQAESPAEAESVLDELEQTLRERLGDALYGTGEDSLATVVGEMLKERRWRVVTAESCTAGMLSALLTEPDGASSFFSRGFVTYAPESKVELLGVSEDLIERVGTVSHEVAIAMAEGALAHSDADTAISITGVAGDEPLDEPPAPKPSGLVYVGLAGESGSTAVELKLRGARSAIRERAAMAALTEFRKWLLRLPSNEGQ